MPIIRVDIPEGHSEKVKSAVYDAIHSAIAETWAKEHIWIALREKFSPAGNRQVMVTVDLRPGRGGEEDRLLAFFNRLQKDFEPLMGTTADDMIVLIRDFPQEAAISEGGPLPPLSSLTPDIASG